MGGCKTGNYGIVPAKMLLHLPTVLFKRRFMSKNVSKSLKKLGLKRSWWQICKTYTE